MNWHDKYLSKLTTAENAAKLVKNGDKVVFPLQLIVRELIDEIVKRKDELRDVTLIANWWNDFEFLHTDSGGIKAKTQFVTRVVREEVKNGRVEWIPWLLGICSPERLADSKRSGIHLNADVLVCSIGPMDGNGFFSFGYGVWYTPKAAQTAKKIIGYVTPGLPWTYPHRISVDRLDCIIEGEKENLGASVLPPPPVDELEKAHVIGSYVGDLVRDGDTIQAGLGTASQAVTEYLRTKNDLGIDSEALWSGMIELIRQGVFTGKNKSFLKGKTVTTGYMITPGDPHIQSSLRFLDHNKSVLIFDSSYVLNVPRICKNNNLVAINSILSIDLLGQAAVDFLGPVPIAGHGGQLEYVIGSHYSKGGRSISCLLSTARGGTISRIVPVFEKGTGILIPDAYIDFLVTEHGVVNLENKGRRDRAEAIISVADPHFRPELREEAKRYGIL